MHCSWGLIMAHETFQMGHYKNLYTKENQGYQSSKLKWTQSAMIFKVRTVPNFKGLMSAISYKNDFISYCGLRESIGAHMVVCEPT